MTQRFSLGLGAPYLPASLAGMLYRLHMEQLRDLMLTGVEFEQWLFNPVHRALPDFLAMPETPLLGRLINTDIRALRALARGPVKGNHLPYDFVAALRRLYAHGIVGRLDREESILYHMTPYSFEVLIHNVSYREGPRDEQLA